MAGKKVVFEYLFPAIHRDVRIPADRVEVLLYLGTRACTTLDDKWMEERRGWRKLFLMEHAGCRETFLSTTVDSKDPVCSIVTCNGCRKTWRAGGIDKMTAAQVAREFVAVVRPGADEEIPVKLVLVDGHTISRAMNQQEVDDYNAGAMLDWRRKHARYI